jgi:hypothetical protein
MDSSHNRQVLTLTIASTTGCLAAFFIYVYLIGVHAYALNGKTRIGGFRLQAPLPSNTALTDHLQALGDPDKVWTPRSRAAMKTCFSVAYLSFTVLGSVALVSAAGLQAHPLAVQITSPSDQAVIDDQPQPVAGIAINLSEHASLWILVYSWDSKTYCPQQRVDIATNGRWTAPMRIGLTYDSGGKKFDLIAVVADRAATESFDNYIREEATSETYPGMKLPNGAQILDRITLIRR